MSIKQRSDIKFSDHVSIGYFARYGKHKKTVLQLAELAERSLPHFRKVLSLPKDVSIRIAGIRGHARGKYYNGDNVALIHDGLSRNLIDALGVIAHELIHGEQYHTGRLTNAMVGRRWALAWDGTVVPHRHANYEKYRALPWEAEAYARQNDITKRVSDMIDAEIVNGG